MKWLKNFERVQEIQQQLVWQPITEMDPRAYVPEVNSSSMACGPLEKIVDVLCTTRLPYPSGGCV